MVHAALLLLMLEAVATDLVSTISLKRSTQNLQLSTSCRPITPSLGHSQPSQSVQKPTFVRYYSNSGHPAHMSVRSLSCRVGDAAGAVTIRGDNRFSNLAENFSSSNIRIAIIRGAQRVPS